MSPFEVSVHIFEEYEGLVSHRWLRRVAEHALAERPEGPHDKVSVVVAGDELVRTLNKRHRGLDENTDVLAFSFDHEGDYYGDRDQPSQQVEKVGFVLPPGQDGSLGEVVISYPQAQRQAGQSGHPIEKELAILLIHGILHLLGYDHRGHEEEKALKAIEARVLTQVWGGVKGLPS